MAITAGDATDGVRTGLAGRIANDEVAAFVSIYAVTFPAGTNRQRGINALAQGIVDALNNDKVDPASQILSPEAWNAPGFLNAWVNSGGSDMVAGYYREARSDGSFRVYVRGKIKSGTIATAAFQLPSGYRPSGNVAFACASNGLFGETIVDTSGNVIPQVGSNVWFDFGGITFDTR